MLTERDKKALHYPSFTSEYVESKVTSPDFFARGKQYQKDKRVKNLRCNNKFSRFTATVNGTRDYSLVVCFRNGKLTRHTCTCPAHEKYEGPCKHVVAVMLEILMRRERACKRWDKESGTTISVSPQKTVITDNMQDYTQDYTISQTTISQTTVSPPAPEQTVVSPPKNAQTIIAPPREQAPPDQSTITPPALPKAKTEKATYTAKSTQSEPTQKSPKENEHTKDGNGFKKFIAGVKTVYDWCMKHLKQIILFIVFGLPLIDGIRSAILYSFLEGVKTYFIGVAVMTAAIIVLFIFSKILDWLFGR